MKVKFIMIPLALITVLLLVGCFNAGTFLSHNETEVTLSSDNYQIIATNAFGEAKAGYLLGFSWSLGTVSETMALLRVSGTGMLYKEALEDLWNNFEREYGDVKGRKLALVNVRYDGDCLNAILYTESRISIRADIVEFK